MLAVRDIADKDEQHEPHGATRKTLESSGHGSRPERKRKGRAKSRDTGRYGDSPLPEAMAETWIPKYPIMRRATRMSITYAPGLDSMYQGLKKSRLATATATTRKTIADVASPTDIMSP